jgi:isoleucyl-tRNA synthetase
VRVHEGFVAGEVLANSVTYGPVADGSTGTVAAPDGTSAEVHAHVTRTA